MEAADPRTSTFRSLVELASLLQAPRQPSARNRFGLLVCQATPALARFGIEQSQQSQSLKATQVVPFDDLVRHGGAEEMNSKLTTASEREELADRWCSAHVLAYNTWQCASRRPRNKKTEASDLAAAYISGILRNGPTAAEIILKRVLAFFSPWLVNGANDWTRGRRQRARRNTTQGTQRQKIFTPQ